MFVPVSYRVRLPDAAKTNYIVSKANGGCTPPKRGLAAW